MNLVWGSSFKKAHSKLVKKNPVLSENSLRKLEFLKMSLFILRCARINSLEN